MSLPLSRTLPRALAPFRSTRLFTTHPAAYKSTIDAAKETIQDVNLKTGKAAAEGIEKGQQATQSLKESIGINAKKMEGEAKGKASEVQGKAHEMAGEVKGKAKEAEGEVKGRM